MRSRSSRGGRGGAASSCPPVRSVELGRGRLRPPKRSHAPVSATDAHWRRALDHAADYRLARGEAATLRPLADQLRAVDPAAAAALDCRIAIGERRYADAVVEAERARGVGDPIADLDA